MPRDEDVITRDPLNAETSWAGLREARTPTSEFYTRNNNPIPTLDEGAWRLDLQGFDGGLRSVGYADVLALPAERVDVVLECAGNGRTYFEPRVEGTPWRERAVGCASFRGARLRDLLARAGVPRGTAELVFLGGDAGGKHPFERSLPLEVALREDTLLAYEMNDAPLLPRHGAPVRLLVPGWYGVASVKWLTRVRASPVPFEGHYQTERYVHQVAVGSPATPVREKRVNSLVSEPVPGARAVVGRTLRIAGWAWSGGGAIVRVEVSLDGGRSWREARLDAEVGPHAWRGWSLEVAPGAPGELVILARAHDAAGHQQPDEPAWNVHGYGYNAPRPRVVPVDGRLVPRG